VRVAVRCARPVGGLRAPHGFWASLVSRPGSIPCDVSHTTSVIWPWTPKSPSTGVACVRKVARYRGGALELRPQKEPAVCRHFDRGVGDAPTMRAPALFGHLAAAASGGTPHVQAMQPTPHRSPRLPSGGRDASPPT
jgi:hypothetical protein